MTAGRPPFERATPETTVRPFQGQPAHKAYKGQAQRAPYNFKILHIHPLPHACDTTDSILLDPPRSDFAAWVLLAAGGEAGQRLSARARGALVWCGGCHD
jgi:hypothetical protein